VPLLATELKNAAAALPGYFLRLKVFSREWLYRHQQNYYFGQALNHFDEFWRFPMVSETWLLNAQKLALGLVSSVVHFLFSLLITLVITFYLLLESRRMKDWFLQIVPQSRRNEVSSVLQSINEKIGRYVQAQFLISFMVAGCNVLILMMLKVDYAFVVGTIVGLASIIPVVGSVFGISANLFFGMMDSSWKALVAGAGYLVIQFFTDHFISPQLIGRRTQIHPLVVFLGVLVGAELLGPLGILMAVPVLIVGREVFAFFQQRGFK
jgi:predicted PurR-regulated permease PerM